MAENTPRISRRSIPDGIAEELTESGMNPVLARLYAARGITSKAELSGELGDLMTYKQLLNAEKAADILADCIISNKHINIACDFDTDGCGGAAIALRGLRMMGARRVSFSMPRRNIEGYGLTKLLVENMCAAHNPDLILTVDCGISSFDGIAEANRRSIPCIITDHHLVSDSGLPDALCIVNPNQPGCSFDKNICGSGVIFYVMLALRAKLREIVVHKHGRNLSFFEAHGLPEPNLASLLDIVALATIGDVVRLSHNNRTLIQHGLMRIRAGRACPGINALLRVSGKRYETASVFDCAFCIVPRINASGRLEDMTLGLKCLTTDDPDDAEEYAKRLDEINKERRAIESDMKDAALESLESVDVGDRFSIVLFDPSWHQGVVGIVASRIKELYGRPAIIFAPGDDGKIKGSGRSIPGLHLRDALDLVAKRNPGMLPAFGGHAMAAGVTCIEGKFDEFAVEFEKVVRELIDASALEQVIETDGPLSNDEIDFDLVKELSRRVWGQGFPAPRFDDEFRVLDQRILKGKHLKLKLAKDGKAFDAIWFFHNENVPVNVRAVYELGINEYLGNVTIQMLLHHVEPAGQVDLF